MSRIELQDIMDEIVYFLRNNIADPKGRPLQTSEYFSGDSSTKTFTLHTPKIKSVSSVTVGGTAQTYGTGYSVSLDPKADTSTITFASAPGSGTNNIKVTYYYGLSWIYDKYPDSDVQIQSFPRLSVDLTNMATVQQGIGNTGDRSSLIVSVAVDGRNTKEVRDIISDTRNAIAQNKQNFYNFNHITPVMVSPITPVAGLSEEIRRSVADFEIPFIWETTS